MSLCVFNFLVYFITKLGHQSSQSKFRKSLRFLNRFFFNFLESSSLLSFFRFCCFIVNIFSNILKWDPVQWNRIGDRGTVTIRFEPSSAKVEKKRYKHKSSYSNSNITKKKSANAKSENFSAMSQMSTKSLWSFVVVVVVVSSKWDEHTLLHAFHFCLSFSCQTRSERISHNAKVSFEGTCSTFCIQFITWCHQIQKKDTVNN